MSLDPGWREVGGGDPIDAQLPQPMPAPVSAVRHVLLGSRSALGLARFAAPALIFVPLGAALGPHGARVLQADVLAHLGTVLSIGLAVLGVFVGMAVDWRRQPQWRLLVAATAEAMVTVAVVAGAFAFLLASWGLGLDLPLWPLALTLGVCASASSAGLESPADPLSSVAARVADLDDLVPIFVGGAALALARGDAAGAAAAVALSILLGAGVAAAGWFLLESTHSEAERGVFVIGTLVLLGGLASYLGLSPLLVGLAAGAFWRMSPGRVDAIIRIELGKVQHPLVILVLLAAGATLVPDWVALWLLVPYVLFRLAGKLTGGWVAARVLPGVSGSGLAAHLIAPGVLGIAFALAFQQGTSSSAAAPLITAVAVGTLAFEVLAVLTLAGPRKR